MPPVVRPFRGVSAQDRRATRRGQLLDAALDVLGEHGRDGFTMTAVCRRAKLTERYFYESFANRDELLIALFDQLTGQMSEQVLHAADAVPADASPRDKYAGALRPMIRALAADPRQARAYVECFTSDLLRAHRAKVVQTFTAVITEQVLALSGDPARARVEATALLLIGGIHEVLHGWLTGAVELTEDELVDEFAAIGATLTERLILP
ncbi:TetR/AcrR family transcriptional regulator [Amycolatopsis sp. 195334CR]|uniref:TetR/AcrR family transcriptional regulator n=1 Tax=Amycolatopsis sp. 195334CR TaxID=2814588 RepID=UPI001A8D1F40|nr:TetR/AcrR family transcriptional regulator [Amycolatopsis sp. 195334CR]MBN6036890.1 TetR/AcrR family transcriptional regulator [Amycolatopsis sp. 195334CR]